MCHPLDEKRATFLAKRRRSPLNLQPSLHPRASNTTSHCRVASISRTPYGSLVKPTVIELDAFHFSANVLALPVFDDQI